MKRRHAKWGVSQLFMAICMLVVAGSAFAAGEALLHNSDNLGTTYGTWGVVGGKYGQFTCATCHNRSTNNVKLVAGTITSPLGVWSSSKTASVPVVFNNMTAFGNDAGGHATSVHICEVCHSKTAVHKYNTAGQADLSHKGANQTDCTVCHSHNDAFKGKGCTSCHGSTASSFRPMTSGKHTAHITLSDAVGLNYGCVDCHATTVSSDTSIKSAPNTHQNGVKNYSGARAGGNFTNGNCSNAYCHTNGKGGVPATAVNWKTGPTLDCKGCHGGGSSQAGEPIYANGGAGAADANTHPKHVGTSNANTTCQNCHGLTMSGTVLNASGKHTDTFINVSASNGKTFGYASGTKTCSNISCHSSGLFTAVDTRWGATMPVDCSGCHGGNAAATTKIVSAYHAKHTDQASVLGVNLGCVECHAQTVTNDTTLVVGNTTHMNSLANFSGAKAGKVRTSCQSAYCHSDGKGGAGTAVSWTTAGTTLDCKGCHGGGSSRAGEPVYASGSAGSVTANSHPKHVGTSNETATCQYCHAGTMNGTALNASGKHLNKFINVTSGNGKSFGYKVGTKTCSNNSCHSGNGIIASVADAQWGATMPTDCTGCHGNETTAATKLSGAHNSHVNNASAGGSFKCKDCHAPTITNADNRTITTTSNHGNNIVNYSGAKAGNNKNCANIYCHSNGKGTPAVIPAWTSNTNLTCESCHATASLLNDHAKHLAKSATCSQCHSSTTTTSNSITGSTHIDGTVDLQQGGTFGSKAVSFSPSGTTCNNISCHSPATSGPYTNTATWGTKAACDACHPTLSAGHTVHVGALNLSSAVKFYNMTANNTPVQDDTVKTYGFGCANCHPMDAANHINNTVDVELSSKGVAGTGKLRFLNSTTATNLPTYSAGKCNNIYCHSNASRVVAENVYKESPVWETPTRTGTTFTGDRCAGCHDNQPATGAHAAHAVGIHSDNIYNGKSGKISISNRANTAHGNPNNSTTIGCYLCHQDTVVVKGNDQNTKCKGCHNGTDASLKGDARINNLKNHVNGSREIKFLAVNVISKAQVRSTNNSATNSFQYYSGVWQRTTLGTAYKNFSTLSYDTAKNALDTATMWHPSTPMASNCSNIACHNGKPVSWNLANWNDPNKCMDCHNQL